MTTEFKPADAGFATTVRDSFARQGLMTLLGARLAEVAPGRVVIALAPTPQVMQQAGSVHGGVLGAIADSAGGYAALSLMPAGSEVVTVEYKINFMRPATGALLRAVGEVIRPGRTLTVARVTCEAGTPGGAFDTCALVQATFIRVAPVIA